MATRDVIIRLTVKGQITSEQAVRQVRRALKDLDTEVKASTSATTKATKESKTLAQTSVEAAGSVAKYAAQHKALELVLRSVQQGVEKTAVGVRTGLTLALTAATAKLKELAKAAGALAVRVLPLLVGAAAAVAAVIGVKLVLALGGALRQMGLQGATIQVLAGGFDNLSKAVGSTGDRMLKILRQGTLNAITNFELLRVGSFVLSTELVKTEAQMAEIARLGTLLGIAVGKDAAFGIDKLTRGIVLHNIATLKQLNLVVDTQQAYRDYAKELEVTVGQLDDVQRRTAFANAVLAKANELTARQNIELANVATSAGKAATAIVNLRDALKTAAAESEQLAKFEAEAAEVITNVGAAAEGAAVLVERLTDAVFGLSRAMLGLFRIAGFTGDPLRFLEDIGRQRLAIEATTDTLKLFKEAIAELVEEAKRQRIAAAEVVPVRAIAPPLELPLPPLAPPNQLAKLGLSRGTPTQPIIPTTPPRIPTLFEEEPGRISQRMTALLDAIFEPFEDKLARQAELLNELLVPAMEAMNDAITISKEEVSALGQDFVKLNLNETEMAERLREMGLATDANIIAVQKFSHVLREDLAKELAAATKEANRAAEIWAAAMQGIVRTAIQGGKTLEIVFAGLMNALARQVERTITARLGGGVGAGLFGGLVGGIFAGLGLLLTRRDRDRPIPVVVTNPIRIAPEDRDRPLVIQLINPTTGQIVEEFIVEAERLKNRGGIPRIPRPFGQFRGI